MSDESTATAGSLLRAAREKQGLHIAALAASIKVTPRKLDALEHDRYDELPDATFTRALAQTVCRSLKIDPRPVLALLPHADPTALDHVSGTLNTPFRDRPGREAPGGLAVAAIRPLVWAGAALLLAAFLVYFLPSSVWQTAPAPAAQPPLAAASVAASPLAAASVAAQPLVASAAAPGATPASAPASPASAVLLAAAPTASAAAAPPAPAVASLAGLLRLEAEQASWVEVRDAGGKVLLSRVLQPSENVGFDGALPLKLTIGNAGGTRVRFRGKAVDLAASTRDNVARLELQ